MESGEHRIAEIFQQYHEIVYQYCLFFTSDISLAEDFTQETFIKVVRNLDKLQDASKLKPWILKIARHTIMDFYRKKRVTNFLSEFLLQKQVSKDVSPEDAFLSKEVSTALQEAISKLKLHHRNVIIYRAIWELSVKETAELLDCSEAKVRVDYHRAIKQLQSIYISGEEGGFSSNEKRA